MAEFEDKLNALLSNPEAMNQIMSFAQSLGKDASDQSTPPPDPGEESSATDDATTAMPDLGDLLSGLSGGLDPAMIQTFMRIMGAYQNSATDDKNMALIAALRPFLKEKRQAKMDQAIQLAKFSRIARVAFQTLKGGDGFV